MIWRGHQKRGDDPLWLAVLSFQLQSVVPCWAVNQLPSLTPSFFTPLTRLIPAARSALRLGGWH
jgi:hypothetical protein